MHVLPISNGTENASFSLVDDALNEQEMGYTSSFLLGQENWDSKVPLKITLAQSEITTIDNPPPLYIQGARMGYINSVVPEALLYFRHVLPPGKDTPWFDSNGIPLRWQTPLGVLYDLMTAKDEKPWALTIHFRGYPSSDLLPWTGPESLRAAFINSLKEAAYIHAGSSAAVMGMASATQNDLWKSIEDSNFGQYYRISESMGMTSGKQEKRRHSLPVRVFIRNGQGSASKADSLQYTSRPLAAAREDLSQKSLGEALEDLLPEYFEVGSRDNSNIGETASVSAAGAAASDERQTQASTAGREDEGQQWLMVGRSGQQALQIDGKQVEVWISGIRTRLDTPLAWLHIQLHHPDHFLYIVLHVY